jgi:hypothetical protein
MPKAANPLLLVLPLPGVCAPCALSWFCWFSSFSQLHSWLTAWTCHKQGGGQWQGLQGVGDRTDL